MIRSLLALTFAAVSLAACAPQDDGPIQVENTNTTTSTTTETSTSTNTNTNTGTSTNTNVTVPATPKGTVSGQVLDVNLAPLQGARVALTIGSTLPMSSLETGADGVFQFTEVPAGSNVLLTISRMGYATLRSSVVVPSSAGNTPLNDANANLGAVVLVPLDGRQSFRVTGPTGALAVGARARLALDRTSYLVLQNFSADSRLVVEATVDAAGLLTFTGIPRPSTPFLNANWSLSIDPLDGNNDGLPETSAFYDTYDAQRLLSLGSLPSIRLDYPQAPGTAFQIDSSNVAMLVNGGDRDPLRNMVRPTEPIRVTFNHPVQPSSVEVRLTDETARDRLDVTVTVSSTGNTVTITPAANTVRQSQEYNLFLRAVSSQNGAVISRTAFFFAGDASMPQTPAIARIEFIDRASDVVIRTDGRLDPGERVLVTFNQPILARNQGAGSNVEAFFDADIDGNNSVGGTSVGELGNTTLRGLNIFPSEPSGPNWLAPNYVAPVFPIFLSGYTTRVAFDYTGSRALDPSQVQVFIRFSVLPIRFVEPYETIWGTPLTQDLSGTMMPLPVNTVTQG